MQTIQRKAKPIGVLAGVGLTLLCGATSSVRAQQSYAVTVIAPKVDFSYGSGHYCLNPTGHLSGAFRVSGQMRAFRWDPICPNATTGTLVTLGAASGYGAAEALGINNRGDVVGRAEDPSPSKLPESLLWPLGGSTQVLGGGGAAQEEADAINASGDIALMHYSSKNTASNGVNVSKVVKGKRQVFLLGSGWPADLNDAGQVLGMRGGTGEGVPLWTPTSFGATTWTKRIIVPDGTGHDLNENGEAVGEINRYWAADYLHPFVYLPVARYGLPAGTSDLWSLVSPILPPPSDPSALWLGRALGINDNGVVLGDAMAFRVDSNGNQVYTGETLVWLWDAVNGARVLSLGEGWTMTLGEHRINNYGQIVGTATNGTGTEYCVLLTPTGL